MRKRLRSKKRRCALCRPDKRGWATRWPRKDLEGLKAFEKARARGDWGSL